MESTKHRLSVFTWRIKINKMNLIVVPRRILHHVRQMKTSGKLHFSLSSLAQR